MKTEIRTYASSDKEKVLEIFKSNCPKYFDINDQSDLIHFLETYADENFKVLLFDNNVIGCGGHYIKHSEKIFGISWVMFKRFAVGHANFLNTAKGFFNHILTNIEKEKFDYDIVINTTQLMETTFNKFDFVTEKILTNGFGENLDHYVMRRKLKI